MHELAVLHFSLERRGIASSWQALDVIQQGRPLFLCDSPRGSRYFKPRLQKAWTGDCTNDMTDNEGGAAIANRDPSALKGTTLAAIERLT